MVLEQLLPQWPETVWGNQGGHGNRCTPKESGDLDAEAMQEGILLADIFVLRVEEPSLFVMRAPGEYLANSPGNTLKAP